VTDDTTAEPRTPGLFSPLWEETRLVSDDQATVGSETGQPAEVARADPEQPAGTSGEAVLPSDARPATPAPLGQPSIPAQPRAPWLVRRSRWIRGIIAALLAVTPVIVAAAMILNNSSGLTTQPQPSATPTTPATPPPVLPAGALAPIGAAALKAQPLTAAGGGGHLSYPREVVRGPQRRLYVVDPVQKALLIYSVTGAYVRTIHGGRAPFKLPFSLTVGRNGHLYVVDNMVGATWDFKGAAMTFVRTFASGPANGLAHNAAGNIYLASAQFNRILVFNPHGTIIARHQTPLSAALGQFNQPSALAITRANHTLIYDNLNRRVEEFSPSWQPLGQWPAPATDTSSTAHLLSLSPTRFLMTDPSGAVLDYDISATPATIRRHALIGGTAISPVGIALLSPGVVVITDTRNKMLWKVAIPRPGH